MPATATTRLPPTAATTASTMSSPGSGWATCLAMKRPDSRAGRILSESLHRWGIEVQGDCHRVRRAGRGATQVRFGRNMRERRLLFFRGGCPSAYSGFVFVGLRRLVLTPHPRHTAMKLRGIRGGGARIGVSAGVGGVQVDLVARHGGG
ncbi:MAG: hypothetical protein C5S49_04930 [Candidatus Methanogaster sp.]|nr:MAG: hypothetical protein C5S49_04930 [ANME-2 cluster archaeon]